MSANGKARKMLPIRAQIFGRLADNVAEWQPTDAHAPTHPASGVICARGQPARTGFERSQAAVATMRPQGFVLLRFLSLHYRGSQPQSHELDSYVQARSEYLDKRRRTHVAPPKDDNQGSA